MIYSLLEKNVKHILFLISFLLIIISFNYEYYIPPLGGDEFLTVWPFKDLIFQENFIPVLKIFGNNYFFEDHISPFFTLFASIMPIRIFDPIFHVKILNLSAFAFIILFLYLISFKILKNKLFSLFFVLFVFSNKALIYQHISYYYSYTIVFLFQLISFYLLLKLLENFNYRNFILYSVSSLIGTLTYENFFLFFFFEATYVSFITFHKINSVKIRNLTLIGTKSLFCLSIYFFLHKIKYGTFIVGYSRPKLEVSNDFFDKFRMITQNLFDDIFFGLPYLYKNLIFQLSIGIFFIMSILIFFYYQRKKFTIETIAILVSIIFSYFGILFTGRYDPGLWTFFSILVYLLFFSLIFKDISIFNKKIFKFIFIILLLGTFNFSTPSKRINIENEKKLNQYYFDKAAFKILEKKKFFYNIMIKDYSDLKIIYLYHPVRFMIGVEIFDKKDGLYYFKNEKSYWPKNHQILMIKNNQYNNEVDNVIKTNLVDPQILNLFNYFWLKETEKNKYQISFFENSEYKQSNLELMLSNDFLNQKNYDKIKIEIPNIYNLNYIHLKHGNEKIKPKIINNKIVFELINYSNPIQIIYKKINITNMIKFLEFEKKNLDKNQNKFLNNKSKIQKRFITSQNNCRLIIYDKNKNDYEFNYYGIIPDNKTLVIDYYKNYLDEKNLQVKFDNLKVKKVKFYLENQGDKDAFFCD
jgi:hypothetical protein